MQRACRRRRGNLYGLSITDEWNVGFENIRLNPDGAEIGDLKKDIAFLDVLAFGTLRFVTMPEIAE